MKLELRMNTTNISTNDEGKMICEGLVNKTDAWSHELGFHKRFVEKIKKGAFTDAIGDAQRIDFLAEHDTSKLLATTENGSLELFEDEEGLQMRAEICPTSYGKDFYELMKSGMVKHMSFGFKAISDSWSKRSDGLYERVIEKLALAEVSIVRNPAYPQSVIAARGIELVEDVEIPDIKEEVMEDVKIEETVEEVVETVEETQEERCYIEVPWNQERATEEVLRFIASATSISKYLKDENPELANRILDSINVSTDVISYFSSKIKQEIVDDQVEEVVKEIVSVISEERSEEPVVEETSVEEVIETTDEVVEDKETEQEIVETEVVEETVDLSHLKKLIKEDITL